MLGLVLLLIHGTSIYRCNPLPGESKGIHILDIEKLSARFGKELSLTCSQWSEAAVNMFRFQQARDEVGDEGEHAAWFDNHFNFFNVHKDRDELYEAWKVVELELRKDHRSQNLAFNAPTTTLHFQGPSPATNYVWNSRPSSHLPRLRNSHP